MDPDSACLAAGLLGVPGAGDPDYPSLSSPNELTALNDEVLAAVGGAWEVSQEDEIASREGRGSSNHLASLEA